MSDNLPNNTERIYPYSQTLFCIEEDKYGKKKNPNQNWHTTCRIKIKDDLFCFDTNQADLKGTDSVFQD